MAIDPSALPSTPPTSQAAPPAAPPAQPAPASPASAPAPDPTSASWLDTLPVEAKKAIQELRQENASWRTKNKELEPLAKQARDIQAALGSNGQPIDPTTLLETTKAQVAEKDKEIRRLKVTSALSDQYAKHGVKATLTRDLLTARGLLNEVDPDAPDFDKSLSGVIKKLMDEVPEIKLAPAAPAPPPKGGADTGPGPGGVPRTQVTREQLKTMKPEEIQRALATGQLDDVLGRKK